MAGTSAGNLKGAATMKARYGDDCHEVMGRMGGKRKVKKGFAVRRDLAVYWGKNSRKAKPTEADSPGQSPHGRR